jgi:ABC-2 type transport system ATP-binding protein
VVEFACDGPVDLRALTALPGVHGAKSRNNAHSLTVEQLYKTLPLLLDYLEGQGRKLTGLSTHHATLEDVFVNLTGRQLRD